MPSLLGTGGGGGGKSVYQRLLGSTKTDMDMSWLCSHPGTEGSDSNRNRNGNSNRNRTGKTPWLRKNRDNNNNATRSKTPIWGPTHSLSTDEGDGDGNPNNHNNHNNDGGKVAYTDETKNGADDIDASRFRTPPSKAVTVAANANNNANANNVNISKDNSNSQGTASTKSSHEFTPDGEDRFDSTGGGGRGMFGRVWNNLQCLEDTTTTTTTTAAATANKNKNRNHSAKDNNNNNNNDDDDDESQSESDSPVMNLFESVCSPCKPKNLGDTFSVNCDDDTPLGISRLAPPNNNVCTTTTTTTMMMMEQPSTTITTTSTRLIGSIGNKETFDEKSTTTVETAADRRRQRHKRRQLLKKNNNNNNNNSNNNNAEDVSSPQEAYEVTPDRVVITHGNKEKNKHHSTAANTNANATQAVPRPLPLKSLELNAHQAVELERCISELTMRSSYGEATAKIAENRRMAYYAVGRHHRQSGRGGNRRCYFTGKLILGGAPFYAGSVQQGLRTLVVFCLPSAVGLPKETQKQQQQQQQQQQGIYNSNNSYSYSNASRSPTIASLGSGRRSNLSNRHDGNASVAHSHSLNVNNNNNNNNNSANNNNNNNTNNGTHPRSVAGASLLSRKNSRVSRLSSMDDATSLGYSVEEELDPNWELDRDFLLRVLPEPKQELLDEMAIRYPTQFETLPVQVRSPSCWSLYVKFCFFSGLPIAEGEMHYKVRDNVVADASASTAHNNTNGNTNGNGNGNGRNGSSRNGGNNNNNNNNGGEEIILSHEVMEAVNGESAEILRLPNLKTFRYLRKHYHQQSAKLPDNCFQRQAWEMVRPEV